MGAAVKGIDHDPTAIGDLVDHADPGNFTDERGFAWPALEDGKVCRAAVDTRLPQGALHHLEGVGALTKSAQLRLEPRIETPDAWLQLGDKAEPLQGLQAADLQALLLRAGGMLGCHGENAIHGPSDDLAIKTGQALLLDLPGQFPQALDFGFGAKLEGDERLSASANAIGT
jgi:hypothetical protein